MSTGDETEESDCCSDVEVEHGQLALPAAGPQVKDRGLVKEFSDVRALMWREDWLRRQIAELEEREAAAGRAEEGCMQARRNRPLLPPAPDTPAAGGWRADGQVAAAQDVDGCGKEGDEGGSKREEGREELCAREENWGAALAARGKVTLVYATIPPHLLPKGTAGQTLFDPRKRRVGSSAALAQLAKQTQLKQQQVQMQQMQQQQQAADNHVHVTKQGGSVMSKQGAKLITEGGQKLVIKFTGKADAQPKPAAGGQPPMSPHLGSVKNKFLDKRPHKALALGHKLGGSASGSPRMGPTTPTTPRTADWGIDDYVYGGPRTHTVIETVTIKEIYTPKWVVMEEEEAAARPRKSVYKQHKKAVKKPGDSSSEDTDDEAYLKRHQPYQDQEIKFRYPKLIERERKFKEAMRKEGLEVQTAESETLYKSLWYSGRSSSENNLSSMADTSPRPGAAAATGGAQTSSSSSARKGTPEGEAGAGGGADVPSNKAVKSTSASSPGQAQAAAAVAQASAGAAVGAGAGAGAGAGGGGGGGGEGQGGGGEAS